ncbi:MAG: glycosyltransferase family 2 protein [Erysipelotrichaceae bacterium]|nr:glycosyltransferase family 2 protein [Erysipelotrichaceae bacterium]
MKKITVVVPIYNVEKYVRICFDSLLKQTFEDFVVMAVNDGSPANEQVIIDEYVNKYPEKFIGIKKPNGGYGSVLQYAIEHMETEYFLVCDPDDYLSGDALEHLYNLAISKEADLVIGAKSFIYEGSDDQDYDVAYNKRFVTLKNEHVYLKSEKEVRDLLFVDPSPHSKLYKRNLAKKIVFPTKVGYTDNLLFYISYLNAQRLVYTDKCCAYYLVNRVGNTMTDVKPQVIDAHVKVFKAILEQSKQCADIPELFYYRMFVGYKFVWEQLRRITGGIDTLKEKAGILYELVDAMKPYRNQIQEGIQEFSDAGRNEKIKDQLLFTGLGKMIYNRNLNKLIQEKEGK